jgi:hypothetical protein
MTHPHERALEAGARALAKSDAKNGRDPADHFTDYRATWERMARAAIRAYLAEAGDGWRDIETAPEKHTSVLAVATGVDGRPMFQVTYYCCAKHMMLSSRHPSQCDKECDFTLEPALGVPYTHWRPLPAPPAAQDPRP